MAKKGFIFLLLAITVLQTDHISAKSTRKNCCKGEASSKQVQEERTSKRYKKKKSSDEKISLKDKARDWTQKTWGNIQNFFNKAKVSVQETFDRPKNKTKKNWKASHYQHQTTLKSQKLAHKAEELISAHRLDSQDLLKEIEGSDDAQLKKYTHRYHRQAERGIKDAESGRKDLEFALRNVSQESEALRVKNEENLELLNAHRDVLLAYQRESKRARRRAD